MAGIQGVTLLEMMAVYPNLFKTVPLDSSLEPIRQDIANRIVKDNYRMLCCVNEPTLFSQFTNAFFQENKKRFADMYATTTFEYNPIENYDRTEEGTDEYTDNDVTTSKSDNTTGGKDVQTSDGSTTNLISAMNSSGFQNDTQENSDNNLTTSYGKTDGYTGNSTDTLDHKGKHHMRAHGNVGVTTTQEMINQEREVLKFSFCRWISDEFARELMIRIYV